MTSQTIKKTLQNKIVDFPDGTLIISEKIIKLNICTSLKGKLLYLRTKNIIRSKLSSQLL